MAAKKKLGGQGIIVICVAVVLILGGVYATIKTAAEQKVVRDRAYYQVLSDNKEELLQIERQMRVAILRWHKGEKLEARTEFWRVFDAVKKTKVTSSLGIIPAEMAADTSIITLEERLLITIEKNGEVIVKKDYHAKK